MLKCGSCGAALPPSPTLCPNCGKRVVSAEEKAALDRTAKLSYQAQRLQTIGCALPIGFAVVVVLILLVTALVR